MDDFNCHFTLIERPIFILKAKENEAPKITLKVFSTKIFFLMPEKVD
jgi:hypothetical protein